MSAQVSESLVCCLTVLDASINMASLLFSPLIFSEAKRSWVGRGGLAFFVGGFNVSQPLECSLPQLVNVEIIVYILRIFLFP